MRRSIAPAYGAVVLALLLAAMDQTIVVTILPVILADLGGVEHVSWLVTAHILTATVSAPLFGRVSDLHGRRPLLEVAIVAFLAGSVVAGTAANLTVLIVGRAIQGLGSGGLIAMTMTITGDLVPPRQRGSYQGYLAAVMGVASIGGPLVGGVLADQLSWRWAFYLNVPIGILALVVIRRVLVLPAPGIRRRVDYRGAFLLVAATTPTLLVAVWGGTLFPWGSPTIVVLAVSAVVLIGVFIRHERRVDDPIVPFALFADHTIRIATIVSLSIPAALAGVVVLLPILLQAGAGTSAAGSGALLVPLMLGLVTSATVSGRVISYTGRYKASAVVGMAVTLLGTWLLLALEVTEGSAQLIVPLAVIGLGAGMVTPVMVMVVQNAISPNDLGAATSLVQFARGVGRTFGVATSLAVFAGRLTAELSDTAFVGGAPTSDVMSNLLSGNGEAVASLPAGSADVLASAVRSAVGGAFLLSVPLLLIAFVVTLRLREEPLRSWPTPGSPELLSSAP